MSDKLHDIGFMIFIAVMGVIMFLPTAAFSWLITVTLWDAAVKITGAWK
jgi:hypothetical protein